MLLTVDVGNTHTVIGGFKGETLEFMWRIATNKKQTEDELRASLTSLLLSSGRETSSITGVALACVVPQLTLAWQRAARDLFGLETFVCTAESASALFKAAYPNPHEIGADRVAGAIGAVALYGAPVMVVDLGTATNIEIVDKDGFFIGGIIAPGLEMSSNALFSLCSKLPAVSLEVPDSVIGKSTEQAMQAGIVLGEIDRINGLIARVFDEVGYSMPVIATGGLASVIADRCPAVTQTNRELTLEGLRLAFAHA